MMGVSGLYQFEALVVNQNPSSFIASTYSNSYDSSCGYVYGAVGELVGLSRFSYSYINESIQ